MESTSMSTEQPTSRRRKITAILAGGLVLGVGAAVTLAAWNDSEFATGNFAAGSFNLEGSTVSATDGFDDHDVPNAAAVVFDIADHGNIAPGDVSYESFWLRLDADTTSPATLGFVGVSDDSGDNVAHLSYEIHRLVDAHATCDAEAITDSVLVGSGSTLGVGVVGASSDLAIGSTSEPGEAIQMCFVVTAGEDLVQGADASTTWEFEAVSSD